MSILTLKAYIYRKVIILSNLYKFVLRIFMLHIGCNIKNPVRFYRLMLLIKNRPSEYVLDDLNAHKNIIIFLVYY